MPDILTRDANPRLGHGLTAYMLLALAYVVSGKLGLMLALPPGYASPIFPPAGIAVAAAMIGGRKTLPWILLGALLLNLSIGYSPNRQIDATGYLVAFIIAIASMLQAALGGWSLRRMIGYPVSLDHGGDILRFLLLSPLICLVSASLSVGCLSALGIIDAADFGANWAAWWIGDTLGVIVMLPLTMTAAGEPRALWRSRISLVALPMLLIFMIFVAAYLKASQWEHADSLSDFRQYSLRIANQVQTKLEEQESLLEQMASLFIHDENGKVTRDEFHRFVQKSLTRFPIIQALEWAPQVNVANRVNFESAQRKEMPGFAIRDKDASGQLQRAGERSAFYPVVYIEPLAGNEPALGFDLASNPQRLEALNKAIRSGTTVASAAVKLVQERQNQAGILLLMAVKQPDSGLVLIVLRVGDFMDKLLPEIRPMLYTRLIDLDEQKVLYDNFKAGASQVLYEQTFTFGMRRYRLETAPTPAYLKQHRGWQSWGVLSFGILGTGLLGALLLLGTGYTARIKAQVEDKTSQLKQSQESTLEALEELRYQKFALDQHAIVATTDVHGTITYINDKFCEISKYTQGELIGQNHRLLNSGIHPTAFFKEMYHTIGSGKVWNGEICNRAKDGSLYWVMTTIVPYLNDKGKPIQYVAIRADISMRKQAEKMLLQNEERLKLATHAGGIGIWDYDSIHNILVWDDAMYVLYGAKREDFPAAYDTWLTHIHPEDRSRLDQEVQDALFGTQPFDTEFRVMHPNGDIHHIRALGEVFRNEHGKPVRLVGVNWDISEIKKVERLKSEFISTVSHELRTPLTSIRGSLALLVGGVAGALPEKAQPLVDIAHRNSERLILLVNDILDMEKIEAGKMEFQLSPSRLMPLLQQAIDGNRAYADQYKVSYELGCELPDVLVNVDANRFMQVLANLLSNAAKFSPAGGKVWVAARILGQRIRVEVTDHGSGIPEEFKNRIFQKFAQADSSDTRKKGGTGLGLSITRAIVEKMGGSMGFESEANVQTTFFVELPIWTESVSG